MQIAPPAIVEHVVLISEVIKDAIQRQPRFLEELALCADEVALARIQRAARHLQADLRLIRLGKYQQLVPAGEVDIGLVAHLHGSIHPSKPPLPSNSRP